METIIKSNDIVFISWIKNLLSSNQIDFYILDQEMSTTEGNITAIPIRVLVNSFDVAKANKIIQKHQKELNLIKTYES